MTTTTAGRPHDYHPGVTVAPAVDPGAWPTQVASLYRWLLADDLSQLWGPEAVVDELTGLELAARAIGARQALLAARLGELRQHEREQAYAQAVADGSSVPPSMASIDRSAGGEIGLARRSSPRSGRTFLTLARDLDHLPATADAWRRGMISEEFAAMIATETRVLEDPSDRTWVDQRLAHVLESAISLKQLRALVRALVAEIDVTAALRRRQIARGERRVTTRPAADGMAWLTAALPTEDAAAVLATLERRVKKAKADPLDTRSRGQVMADTLTELITGHLAAEHHPEPGPTPEPDSEPGPEAGPRPGPASDDNAGAEQRPSGSRDDDPDLSDVDGTVAASNVDTSCPICGSRPAQNASAQNASERSARNAAEGSTHDPPEPGASPPTPPHERPTPTQRPGIDLRLVMSLDTLFNLDGGRGTALLNGEPIPGYAARAMLTADPDTAIALRRLFTHPDTGQLVAAESSARTFTGGLRDLVATRDHHCRNPFCGAPIRHLDHVKPDYLDGPTSATNGQGLCEACNYLKESPGWRYETLDSPNPGAPPDILLVTPAGRTYTSSPPPLLPHHCQCPVHCPEHRPEPNAGASDSPGEGSA